MHGTQCVDCLAEGTIVSDPENMKTNNGAALINVGKFGGEEIPVCYHHEYVRSGRRNGVVVT